MRTINRSTGGAPLPAGRPAGEKQTPEERAEWEELYNRVHVFPNTAAINLAAEIAERPPKQKRPAPPVIRAGRCGPRN